MKLNNLEDLYIHQLKDLYSAETQLVDALPKMAKAATNPDLKEAFTLHLEETKGQVARLEEIFAALERGPRGKRCKGMEGIIEEGDELIKDDEAAADVKDAGLLAAAQHVEHYEMAGYGTLRTYAQRLGYTEAAALLQQSLDEESAANEKLTRLAESHINQEAQA